jgi:glycosyltransferase involved in cell wall biosynthesis
MRPPADTGTLGLILKGFPRISETFIANEILALEARGFRVRIFSMRRPRENFAHARVARIRARVDYLPEELSLRNLAPLLAVNAHLARRSAARYRSGLALALRRWRQTRKLATWKHFLQAGFLTGRLLPDSGVIHLHAHFAHSPTSVAYFTSCLSGLPFSFTAHAKDIYTSEPRLLALKLAQARFAVTCTEYNRQYLRRLTGPAATPLHLIYHGIDTRQFAHPAPPRNPAAPYALLTVARLTAKKGLPTVFHALKQLKDRGISFQHTLIGEGEDRASLEDLAQRLGLTGVTRWLGTQPQHVVRDHYRRSDVFLIGCRIAPSGDRDGLPNVLAESLAMGLPVVATRVSAIPELITHGETGLLVPPDDPRAMADAVQQALTDRALRRRLIASGRETVCRAFDAAVWEDRLAALYQRHIPGLAPGVCRR